MGLADVHATWAWVVVGSNAFAGCWALAAHWIEPLRTRALWWTVAAAQLSIFLEVILGVIMVAGQGVEAPQFHMFYGFVAIVTVGLIYSYRQQVMAYRYLLYGLGGLFLMGLGLRAIVVR